jgi:hypothetical protein
MTMTDLSGERIKKLQTYMLQAGVDLVAIAPTANMRYLLGFAPLADERPCFCWLARKPRNSSSRR